MYVASNGIKTAVIMVDSNPLHPRLDQDNLGKMVCWHSRDRLGDKHEYRSPHDFAAQLARTHVDLKDLFQFILDGNAKDVRMADKGDYYQIEARDWPYKKDSPWSETEWTVSKNLELHAEHSEYMCKTDLTDGCLDTPELIALCEASGNVAILPLIYYDHSSQSISTTSFVGRAPHADWDSSQVGFIYMDKKTALKNLSAETGKIRLIDRTSYSEDLAIPIMPNEQVDDVMKANGYEKLNRDDITNPDEHSPTDPPNVSIILPRDLEMGHLFKKDNQVFRFENFNPDNTFFICPVATYRPSYASLTEENWKDRALQCLEAEVKEYDAYIQGEVYGYVAYEGMDEIDSCWGFNNSGEDIRGLFDDMFGDWGAELKDAMMSADFDYGTDFDIEEFFLNNDFPELRSKLMEDVKHFVIFENETSKTYPFNMPAEDIIANKDGVLDMITEALYDLHKEPDTSEMLRAILESTGLTRNLQAKITSSDLEPGKEYTQDEMNAIYREKKQQETASVDKLIADAQRRHSHHASGTFKDKKDLNRA